GNRRDKLIIEFDPEIERTLKKNRNRVRTQTSLQFDEKNQVPKKLFLKNLLKKRE
ncbi:hypothetical protein PIB30_112839, partial [Stylosanthes scabra]|nr:hypothetical protein [Stylosanthes scabra]